MNPRYRAIVLAGVTLALLAPYYAFIIHYSRQFPPKHWPVWFTDTIALWFIANFLVLMVVVRFLQKMSKPVPGDVEKVRALSEKALWISTRLLIFWSLLFLYGIVETIRGKVALERALRAGAFLLFFIALFGWGIYRSKHPKRPQPTSLT